MIRDPAAGVPENDMLNDFVTADVYSYRPNSRFATGHPPSLSP
ncbi:hypothetical protein ACQP25_44450 (plasmid) [Microtetraspora malaysiensis]